MREISPPITIDVEASAIGRGSFPIEIGVSMEDSTTHCFLIKPEDDWERWDEKAESIHNLSRETLEAHGGAVTEVASQLNAMLAGKTVFSDAWGFDTSWIALLFHRAGMAQKFRVKAINSILSAEQYEAWQDVVQKTSEELNLTRHRASADALITQLAYLRLELGDAFELPQFGLLPGGQISPEALASIGR